MITKSLSMVNYGSTGSVPTPVGSSAIGVVDNVLVVKDFNGDIYYAGSYVPNIQLNHSALTYDGPAVIDFLGDGFQTITLAGDMEFTTSNLAEGRSKTIRIIADSSTRNLVFPGWKFMGAVAPTTITADKIGILTVTSFGTTDADVVAAYAEEP